MKRRWWPRISSTGSRRRLTHLIAANPVFAAVLLAGAAVRVLTMIAYPPALFFGDSWEYIVSAFSGHPFAISASRPSGYGWLIRIFTLPSRDLVQLVAVQHLAGLLVGGLIYAALLRARVPRTIAAAAAALVVLDGYAITLEQYVMAEALSTLTLLIAALLVVWPALGNEPTPSERPAVWRLALAGLLLASAVLERESALFTIPLFLLYLLWRRVGLKRACAFVVALAIPVLAYAARFDQRYGSFSLSETFGWTMYGRVAAFADCHGAGIAPAARGLCQTAAERRSQPSSPTWYIFDPASTAVRKFGVFGDATPGVNSNNILGGFARRIILHQPLDYLDAAAGDVVRYFTPGATPFDDAISATSLPARASAETIVQDVHRKFLPSVHPQVRSPASLVRAYRSVIHVPRPVLALLALASVLGLVLRVPARREVLLFAGAGLAVIIGSAATAGFGLRYLLPAVPMLAIGGTLAARDLIARRESPANRRAEPPPAPTQARPAPG